MKILVIDDHVLIRQAMQGVLKKLRRDVIVLEAPNARQAMRVMAENSDIQLILLDLTLPDRNGFALLAHLRRHYPAVPVVVLSAVQDRKNVIKALDEGALGYIPKSAEAEVILGALRLVLSGGVYVPPEILAQGELTGSPPAFDADEETQPRPGFAGLTARQLDVLALVMQGKNNKIISRRLNITEATVKNHVSAILKVLNVTNRTEVVIAANQMGYKDDPEVAKQ